MSAAPAAPIRGRRVRFALAGCGRIAVNHFAALKAHAARAELTGVCDVVPERARAASTAHGAPWFTELDAMVSEAKPDVVVISTPSGLHAEQAISVARHGCHVLTEKPMATRWPDALRMIRACDDAGVRLFVVMQNRRNSTLQALKRALDQRRFGRLYLAAINVFWQRPQEYYDAAPWRGTRALDGGALMNQASHYVDLVPWLLGPPAEVHCYAATLARRIESEDTAVVALRLQSGAVASLSVTMLTYPRNLEGSITVIGEKGTVRIGGIAVNSIEQWDFVEPHPEDAGIRANNYATESVYGFGHPLYYENVIDTLQGEADPYTDGREGLKSLELLVAAYRSAETGSPVRLPLETA